MMKYIVIDGFSGNKGGMRNLGEPAHNKEFDTLEEAIEFVKGAKWSIRTLRIDPGFSRSIGRKELNPNLVEEKKMEKSLKSMTVEEIKAKIVDIAKARQYVVVEDKYTDDPGIWGSDAAYDNIRMCGGKAFIINSAEIRHDEIFDRDIECILTVEEQAQDIYNYFNSEV